MLSIRPIAALALALLLFASHGANAAGAPSVCDPKTATGSCNNLPCDVLGMTTPDTDHASILGCMVTTPNFTATDCTAGCTWTNMTSPPLIHVSMELVGGGGGGGGADGNTVQGPGGAGAPGRLLQFDAYVHRGAVLQVSVGGGGGGGFSDTADSISPNGGGALFGRGGSGGSAGATPQSGNGGGGGAASVVMGDGLFAVAGGGGGGGGGNAFGTGLPGDTDIGSPVETAALLSTPRMVPVMDGGSGYPGCLDATASSPVWTLGQFPFTPVVGRVDGGGGGGGGGGYPSGAGGFWGCDNKYGASGGFSGQNYLNSPNPTPAFTQASNASGIGLGGGGGPLSAAPATAGQGECGRVTIWSSTGQKTQFDCNSSAPFWIVK